MLIEFENINAEKTTSEAITEDIKVNDIALEHLTDSVSPLLEKGCGFQYVSNGHWSMHQLLQLLLYVSGPADVYISSYAFSELPARTVAKLKEDRTIRRLHCIIDSRIDVRSAGALQLLMNTADKLKLCATHAKVTVVCNEDFQFVVIGSANYTTNKRYESGIIREDKTLAYSNIEWIMEEINKRE